MTAAKGKFRRIMSWGVVATMLVQMFAGVVPVFAADTGLHNPSANTTTVTGWTNPERAYLADEGTVLTRYTVANAGSDVVDYSVFGFNIPNGATIDGIQVRVDGYTSINRQAVVTLSGNQGVAYTTGPGAQVTTSGVLSENTSTLGGIMDKWGKSWSLTELSDANFRLRLDATNQANILGLNYIAVDQVQVRVFYTNETELPVVGPVSVATDYGTTVDGHSFSASASVSDALSGTDTTSCQYTIDGGSNWYEADYSGGNCYKNGLTATEITLLGINFRVSDVAGNVGVGAAINRTADTNGPTFNITVLPDFNLIFTSAKPKVTAKMSDLSDITSCSYRYKLSLAPATDWSTPTAGTIDGNDCVANLSVLNNAQYVVAFEATDEMGHVSGSTGSDIERNVDGDGPSAPSDVLADKNPTNQDTQNWTWTPSVDNGSGVAKYEICIDADKTDCGFSLTSSAGTAFTIEGSHTVYVRAIDNVGNASSWAEGDVYIDKTDPTIALEGDNPITLIYGESYVEPGFSAEDDHDGVIADSSVSISDNIDYMRVGDYEITYTVSDMAGNETTVYRDVKIVPAVLRIIANDKTKVYGEADPEFTYTAYGFQYNDIFTEEPVCGVGAEHVNAGLYVIECNGGVVGIAPQEEDMTMMVAETEPPVSNYVIEYINGSLVVEKAKLTITAKKQSKVAGDTDPKLTYDLTSGSLLFSDTLTGGLSRASGEDPGFYTITQGSLTAGDNYEITFVKDELEIKPAPVLVAQGDDTDVSSTDTKKDEDVKGKTDKKADVSFWDTKTFGVSNWLWLLLFGALGGWGWWFIAGRQRRDDDEEE